MAFDEFLGVIQISVTMKRQVIQTYASTAIQPTSSIPRRSEDKEYLNFYSSEEVLKATDKELRFHPVP